MRATTAMGCLAAAALSIFVVAPAPAYDAWAWLLWGREVAGGALHTAEGPAFKPLPVAVCALLSAFGDAAALLWVIVARTGALLAVVLAFRLGWRLMGEALGAGGAGRSPLVGGLLAAAGVALCGSFLGYAAEGVVTGWLVALGLAGLEAWRAGRPRAALACAVACCLLHVEAWPFAAAFGLFAWLRRPSDRPLLAVAAIAVPALWIVPEWIGSGDPLRSGARARIPNPGQPALADVPALASLEQSARLLLWPLWIGIAALALAAWRPSPGGGLPPRAWSALGEGLGGAAALAAIGTAWVLLVALMAQFGGFSGEPRYATPGVALIAIAAAVGLASGIAAISRRAFGRAWIAAAVLGSALLVAGIARLDQLSAVPAAQAHQWRLANDLSEAVEAAGGRDAVLSCGIPYVGPLRGPLLAHRLDVAKEVVEPDLPPRPPAVVFRSPRRAGARVTPAARPVFRQIAVVGDWQVARACRVRKP
ncbi:MAG TPA: hypothetical protein VHF88_02840 [Thermoleophilaceae bacterium]|nr:hypothetical protein [Thermoleophilaceae bacterium]